MAGSSGDQFVDGLGANLHSGLEAEGVVGGGEVVVDGLGHAHDIEAFLCQTEGDALGAVATNVDDSVNTHILELAEHLVAAVNGGPGAVAVAHGPGEGAALVGGAEDGASLYLKTFYGFLG